MTSRILDNAEVSTWSDDADRAIPQIPHIDQHLRGAFPDRIAVRAPDRWRYVTIHPPAV
jgi:hypothetical protein